MAKIENRDIQLSDVKNAKTGYMIHHGVRDYLAKRLCNLEKRIAEVDMEKPIGGSRADVYATIKYKPESKQGQQTLTETEWFSESDVIFEVKNIKTFDEKRAKKQYDNYVENADHVVWVLQRFSRFGQYKPKDFFINHGDGVYLIDLRFGLGKFRKYYSHPPLECLPRMI